MVSLCAVLGIAFVTQNSEVTFGKDIWPLIRAKCLPCHIEGESGPFPFKNYADVKKHLELIRTVVVSKAMPPYNATGVKLPVAQLTDEEIVKVQKWIQSGAPQGPSLVPAQPASPPLIGGSPFNSPQIPTKADGIGYWIAYRVKNKAAEDLNVQEMVVRPRSPQVVRQVVIGIAPADDRYQGATESLGEVHFPRNGLFGTWSPASGPVSIGPATLTVPKGRDLLVQVFVLPSGRVEDAGIVLSPKEGGERHVQSHTLIRTGLRVEWKGNLEATETWVSPTPIRLLSVLPTARYFAAGFTLKAKKPGGTPTTIAEIPVWNRNWVPPLNFSEGIVFPAGTEFGFTFRYANDEYCTPRTAAKAQPVIFGSGTFMECFRVDLQYLALDELSRENNRSSR